MSSRKRINGPSRPSIIRHLTASQRAELDHLRLQSTGVGITRIPRRTLDGNIMYRVETPGLHIFREEPGFFHGVGPDIHTSLGQTYRQRWRTTLSDVSMPMTEADMRHYWAVIKAKRPLEIALAHQIGTPEAMHNLRRWVPGWVPPKQKSSPFGQDRFRTFNPRTAYEEVVSLSAFGSITYIGR